MLFFVPTKTDSFFADDVCTSFCIIFFAWVAMNSSCWVLILYTINFRFGFCGYWWSNSLALIPILIKVMVLFWIWPILLPGWCYGDSGTNLQLEFMVIYFILEACPFYYQAREKLVHSVILNSCSQTDAFFFKSLPSWILTGT